MRILKKKIQKSLIYPYQNKFRFVELLLDMIM